MIVKARHYCPNNFKHLSINYEYDVSDLLALEELRVKVFKENKDLCKFCNSKTNYWLMYNG